MTTMSTVSDNAAFTNTTSFQQLEHIMRNMAFIKAMVYSENLWFCIYTFVGILFILHLTRSLFYYLRMKGFINDARHNTVHAFVNVSRIVLFRVTLPTAYFQWNIAEASVTLGYLLLLLVWQFMDCSNPFTGVSFDIRYWSVRAGVMAMNQLFLLQALAMKNNPFFILIGISYEKIQILHRVLGRISVGFVWVHFCSQVALGLKSSGLAFQWQIMGILAASSYTVLLLSSIDSFRKRYYEAFLGIHMTLAGIIVIAVYFHVRHSTSFNDVVIPFFILWAMDRALRFFRPLVIHIMSLCRRKADTEKDTIQLISDSVVLITLHRRMNWKAGQHVYLIAPTLSRFPLEAHPFSIAAITGSLDVNDIKALRFIVRARNGFTRRLLNAAKVAGGRATPMSFTLVDGPYGIPPKVEAFKNVILIAGGTGISFTLPLFQHIVKDSSEPRNLCCSVTFCWIVPHLEELNWAVSQLLEALNAAPETLQIDIQLYVTGSSEKSDHPLPSLPQEFLTHEFVALEMRKPDIKVSLRQKIESCDGSTFVAVSGPASLADDVRRTLGTQLYSKSIGSKEIYLHVETYRIG